MIYTPEELGFYATKEIPKEDDMKAGDRVRVIKGHLKGEEGVIHYIEKLPDGEPIAVDFGKELDGTHQCWWAPHELPLTGYWFDADVLHQFNHYANENPELPMGQAIAIEQRTVRIMTGKVKDVLRQFNHYANENPEMTVDIFCKPEETDVCPTCGAEYNKGELRLIHSCRRNDGY